MPWKESSIKSQRLEFVRFASQQLSKEGVPKVRIASQLGVSRSTVYNHLGGGEPPKPRKKRVSKLDSFKGYIGSRLEQFDLPSTVLHRELVARGYTGGLTILRDYVRPFKRDSRETSWMLKLTQGKTTPSELLELTTDLAQTDIVRLLECVHNGRLRYRKGAAAVLAHHTGVSKKVIAGFLLVNRSTVKAYITRFAKSGVEAVTRSPTKEIKKHEDPMYREALFEVLHTPPSAFAINRTSWRLKDIQAIMKAIEMPIGIDNIRRIIRAAGYRVRKAKKVLTSTDPDYRSKLERVTATLSALKDDESFFMVDEFGPFAVKTIGGRALTSPGELRVVPQWQRSKGSLIVTAALELSSNQITHFYSDKKNTAEMIKLLEVVLQQSSTQSRIFFSWDAASWHASKKLLEKVDVINASGDKPTVELVPLPACAQFLNVVESVFSGLARAVLHNSDYQSVLECKEAIDRHFDDRNQHFEANPKRAGNKIWGKERVPAAFSESNNCKDPRW